MRTKTLQLMLTALLGLILTGPASAQKRGSFVIDGNPEEWGGGISGDPPFDVVPDTNDAVDVINYSFFPGGIFRRGVISEGPDTLFTFLIKFVAAPFQDAEETTVELFFDVSQDTTYGAPQPPWSNFRPDYVVGVSGSNGALTKEFYWRHSGSGWEKKKGADISELKVAVGVYRHGWLEGAIPQRFLNIPDTSLPLQQLERINWQVALRVSQGRFRDYVPDATEGASGGRGYRNNANVEAESWGRIKGRSNR